LQNEDAAKCFAKGHAHIQQEKQIKSKQTRLFVNKRVHLLAFIIDYMRIF